VPALRIHFQKCHVGIQTDFVFSCGVHQFNALLVMLLPEASAVRHPLDISFKVPVNVVTRISCTLVSPASHPVSLLKQMLIRGQWLDQQELSAPDGSADSCVLELVPGKYEYSHGLFKCAVCCYKTAGEEAFACHAWKHIHGSWKSICGHRANGTLSSECAIVNGLIGMLKRVALNKATGMLRKNSVSQACESLENCSSVISAGNSKSAFTIFIYAYKSCYLSHRVVLDKVPGYRDVI